MWRDAPVDKSTLPGLALAFGALILSVLIEGGNLAALLNVPAAILVFGGTFATAMISFPFDAILALPKYMMAAVLDKPQNPVAIVDSFAKLADKARREGLLALEQEAANLEPFAKKGIMMVVDGNDPGIVREVMEADVEAME